jgi:hypothetical protein
MDVKDKVAVVRVLAWTGVIAALLLLPVSRKLERSRERADDPKAPAAAVGAAA